MKKKTKKKINNIKKKGVREKLIEGVVRGNKKGFAFLSSEGNEDLFIPPSSLNGAVNNDKVYVKKEKGEAVVVSIKDRGIQELVGVYTKNQDGNYIVKPDDSDYFTPVYLGKEDSERLRDGDKVLVKIIGYKRTRVDGKLLEILGKAGVKDTEILSILKNHGFDNKFSNQVKEQAKNIKRKDIERVDFTSLKTITIDGDDAKDLDDAISLEKTEKGYRLYVHIADVSSFVDMDSPIDARAMKYTTSVYFPECVYPMLPEELSNVICSLNAGENRDTLSVIMDIDKNGEVINSDIKESIIKSDRRMTYKKTTAILNGDKKLSEEYADIKEMLFNMKELAEILIEKRKRRGALFFKSKECVITLNDEGEPVDLVPYEYTVSNSIIEEFMLIANETVAKTFFDKNAPFVYRVHQKPKEEKMNALKAFAKSCGFNMPEKSFATEDIIKLLKEAEGTPYENIINDFALRSMQKARYSTSCDGHYGLQAQFYCHFTSPIRRYPDLMIHRIIKSYLHGKVSEGLLSVYKNKVMQTALNSTEKEIAAENAEREIDDYYKALYMQNHIGEIFEGFISGVTPFGIFVALDNTVEGLVRIESLPGGGYVFDKYAVTLSGGGRKFSLGQKVKIKVIAADEIERHIDFELVETKE